jgi:flagellar basal-body rod protein FlgB
MDSLTTQILVKALDGLSARSIVTAQNIANGGTVGYRPLRLSFEQALADAAGRDEAAVAAVRPQTTQALAGTVDGTLRMDLELATASSTALRYGALIDLLGRRMQVEALVYSGTN